MVPIPPIMATNAIPQDLPRDNASVDSKLSLSDIASAVMQSAVRFAGNKLRSVTTPKKTKSDSPGKPPKPSTSPSLVPPGATPSTTSGVSTPRQAATVSMSTNSSVSWSISQPTQKEGSPQLRVLV